jgi:hypothetical protein
VEAEEGLVHRLQPHAHISRLSACACRAAMHTQCKPFDPQLTCSPSVSAQREDLQQEVAADMAKGGAYGLRRARARTEKKLSKKVRNHQVM